MTVTIHASEAGAPAQPVTRPDRLGAVGGGAYILSVMRRFLAVLGSMTMLTATVSAQSTWADTLPPRAYGRLAMQAKAQDSVASRAADWQAWAAADPQRVAPRLALAMLARFDNRHVDALAWLDSATRVAKTPVWINAATRERISSLLVRGEFVDIPALLIKLMADSTAVPRDEWTESRMTRLVADRRRGSSVTLDMIDSVAAAASPTDSFVQSRLSCLRAGADSRARLSFHATRAIAIADAAGLPFLAANCTLLVGTVLAGAGETSDALDWLMRAARIARASHDLPDLAAALQWHGYTLSTLGFVPWATQRLAESIRVAQGIEDRNVEAWALLGIAHASNQIGDAVSSSSALRRAAILFDATGDTYGAWNARMQQATALVQLGDLVGADEIARRARTVGDSIRQPSLSLRARYLMSDIATRRSRFDDATAQLDSVQVALRTIGAQYEWQLRAYRGILAVKRGANGIAITGLDSSLKHLSSLQTLFRYQLSSAISLAWLRTGDTTKAAGWLTQSNDEMDRFRDSISRLALRRVVTPSDLWGGSSAFPDDVLAALVSSPTWLPTAFAVAERTRSRALVKGSFGSLRPDTAAEMIAARERVRATATSLAEVQRELKSSTALLVYAGGAAGARTSLMVITKTGARGITLAPLDSLDRDIVRWLALLESGESGAGAGRQVATAVLSSALLRLPAGIRRIVIVPQGPLYRVPFQALPFGRGVLGDRVVVTISPSVSLALAYAAAPRSVPARVLAFGAGDTEVSGFTPQSLDLNIERSERGNPLAPLLAAADEARAAAGWGQGSLALTGNDASEAALKRESRGSYTILHAAAHALTSDQTLGANWLILRPDADDDGYVSGGELAELSVGRAMVVLSGCRTTGDFGSRGDAIDGLVAPLLARGVRTVVASHWAVSDHWTKVLMERFYQNLARGVTTSEAMNDAQTSLRREGVPARFWAAFSVIGDGALTFTTAPVNSDGR